MEMEMENLIKVGVGEDGELLLDRLQEPNGDVEAVIGAVCQLSRVPHRPERTPGLRLHVEEEEEMDLREAEHERGAVLLGDEAAELPLALLHRALVLRAHRRVRLPHYRCLLLPPPRFPNAKTQKEKNDEEERGADRRRGRRR
ncbi:hypothetical protein ACMD2_01476 [Ananas comosus]|uniref:Uncharacterized protein n=1 Tax=Ananas comosus TaxID=4615 RepID=A0A199VB03_ANACO|nr:hypothetical protein ACMD2_01476 [Ananas comosus]